MNRPPTVLHIEDDSDDAALVARALAKIDPAIRVERLRTAADTMRFLNQFGEFAHQPTPDLVLLDLGLPWFDGRALLANLRRVPRFSRLPIAVLTASEDPADRAACLAAGVELFAVKPSDADGFVAVLAPLATLLARRT